MKVSFIVPLFNCLSLTQAMLASLEASLGSRLNHEIILVDDGSTDGTRAWLGEQTRYRVLLNETNLGYGESNNRGAREATGDLLVLLNNDLVLSKGWLEPMISAWRSLGRRAGVIGNIQREAGTLATDHAGIGVNLKGKPEHDRRPPGPFSRLLRPARRVPAVTGACMLISAGLWRELGGFSSDYVNGCEDVDLCFRAGELGRINAVAIRSVVLHHVSSSPGRKNRDEENAYRLTIRWRDRLATIAAYEWSRIYFAQTLPEPRNFPSPTAALNMGLFLLHVSPRVPDIAYQGMQASIEVELARWRSMFSS